MSELARASFNSPPTSIPASAVYCDCNISAICCSESVYGASTDSRGAASKLLTVSIVGTLDACSSIAKTEASKADLSAF